MSTAVTIGGITATDSDLARKARALAENVHTPAFVHHIHRTYWFAEFLAKKRQMTFDREVVYIASILHDLGLTDRYCADKRFEVDGAEAAARFLGEQHYPKDRKSTRLNSSHTVISYAVFCLKKKKRLKTQGRVPSRR